MDSVADVTDEEAYVEDEPEIKYEDDSSIKQDAVVIEESLLPESLMYILNIYLSNPWVWLLIVIFAYYMFKKLELKSRYMEWKEKRDQIAEAAHVKKNPDLYRDRMEAMERVRQKQQEAHDIAAIELAEKERKKEEERRAEKLQQLENLVNGKGYNNKSKRNCVSTSNNSGSGSGTSKASTSKSNFRSDYNPLMGGGGGESGYRAERRGNSSGGGG